ncbi:MAG: hypothetical protein N2047_06175 [Meiothermus sp.]|jgi:hypothetical protein|uniref:DUF6839 family protein n=1 Tax=Meiothermus cerbereus TaxID=65552 RepID=UPI003EEBDB74|nr:hypothetical protein [Meiothermus sp.]
MQVADLQDDRYMLLSDLQDRQPVLESLGLEDELLEWPHLLVWVEDGEYREVWGCRFTPPLLSDPVVRLYPRASAAPEEPDFDETVEWRDLEGPEPPAEW